MSTSATSGIGSASAIEAQYSMKIAKLSQDQQKMEGETALKLIESAGAAQPDGRGSLLNVVA